MKGLVWEPRHWMTSKCPWPCNSEPRWPWLACLHRRDSLCWENLFFETTAPCLTGHSLLGIYISTMVHQRMGPPHTQWARGSWDHCWVWEGRRLIAEPLEGWSPLENCFKEGHPRTGLQQDSWVASSRFVLLNFHLCGVYLNVLSKLQWLWPTYIAASLARSLLFGKTKLLSPSLFSL